MKAILFAAGLLLTSNLWSAASPLDPPATHPTGVADVVWGVTPEAAKKAMLEKPGVALVSATADKLVFAGGSFADQAVEDWQLLFTQGRFSEAFIQLTPVDVLHQYDDLRKLITAKYRKGGREEKDGTAHRVTYWDYPLTTGNWGIACEVRIPGGLSIRYKDKSPATGPKRSAAKDL